MRPSMRTCPQDRGVEPPERAQSRVMKRRGRCHSARPSHGRIAQPKASGLAVANRRRPALRTAERTNRGRRRNRDSTCSCGSLDRWQAVSASARSATRESQRSRGLSSGHTAGPVGTSRATIMEDAARRGEVRIRLRPRVLGETIVEVRMRGRFRTLGER